MSDDELRATPYAELWLSELGAVVPEHVNRHDRVDREPPRTPAPDDHDRPGQFAARAPHRSRRA